MKNNEIEVKSKVVLSFLRDCDAAPLGPHDMTCVQCHGTGVWPTHLGYAVLDLISWAMINNPGRMLCRNQIPTMAEVIKYATELAEGKQSARAEKHPNESGGIAFTFTPQPLDTLIRAPLPIMPSLPESKIPCECSKCKDAE